MNKSKRFGVDLGKFRPGEILTFCAFFVATLALRTRFADALEEK